MNKPKRMLTQYRLPLCLLALFAAGGAALWLLRSDVFYFFFFFYIGLCLFGGWILYERRWKYARQAVLLGAGLYMLFVLGIMGGENLQIEGFWYCLFTGTFGGAMIHFLAAKLLGPLVFGRAWCGYCCPTAMVLDLFPYHTRQAQRARFGWLRYGLFALSAAFAALLLLLPGPRSQEILFHSFLIGNVLYYVLGIFLLERYRDNRAFCKYLCPVTVLQRPASYYALLRIRCDREKCDGCGACKRVCPMDVDVAEPSRKRRNGTECILCMACVQACPQNALHL